MPTNKRVTALARRAPFVLSPVIGARTAAAKRRPGRALQAMARQLPPADVAVLIRPAVRDAFVRDLQHASSTTGQAGAQDFRLFARDWGFRLEDIAVPVHVWQGGVDTNVPPAHGRLQAERIPGAVLHEVPAEGHLLFVDHMPEILGEIARQDRRKRDASVD